MSVVSSLLRDSVLLIIAGFTLNIIAHTAYAEEVQELQAVNVVGRPYGEEIVGPYHQPRWSARGRFSADTDVYVLPPYSFYLDVDYHGTFPRQGKADSLFFQEFEIGLPYRLQLAFELYEEHQDGRSQIPAALVEARYAFANWGKIPLNPTLLGEFGFGIGKQYPVQPGANQEMEKDNAVADQTDLAGSRKRATRKNIPDAYELRLLLGQEIGKYIEFASNIFFDQDIGGEHEREIGLSTAISYAIRGEALKVGMEMNYRNVFQQGQGSKARNVFEIGPSFAVKPSPHTRIDLTPLFGTTSDSPYLELFVIFSVDFGTGQENEIEAPVSGSGRF
jgi:hypothetical protein